MQRHYQVAMLYTKINISNQMLLVVAEPCRGPSEQLHSTVLIMKYVCLSVVVRI